MSSVVPTYAHQLGLQATCHQRHSLERCQHIYPAHASAEIPQLAALCNFSRGGSGAEDSKGSAADSLPLAAVSLVILHRPRGERLFSDSHFLFSQSETQKSHKKCLSFKIIHKQHSGSSLNIFFKK